MMMCGVALGATAALTAGAGCGVEVGAAYSPGDDGDYPSEAYIASTEPVYFEGHASYWYGNRWYYRDGNRWAHYNREPAALQQRRLQSPPRQRVYGSPSRGRPVGRAPAPRPSGHR
jgi:hypothetical protein